METVSVIMPCYNDGRYIEQAVASLKAQTYRHIELIVVDDGSDDLETIRVLNRLSFPCMKKIQSDHMGPAFARNTGIAAAAGSYILPLDADDLIDSVYIEKAVSVLEVNSAIGIVYCQAAFFGEKGGKWQLPPYSLKEMLAGNVIFTSAMFRKSDWQKVGGYSQSMKYGLEDYDFWLSLLENGAEVHQIQEILFHYRIKPVSRSSTMQRSIDVLQESYRQIYFNHKKFFEDHHELHVEALREMMIRQSVDIEKMQAAIKLYESRHFFLTLIKKVPGVRSLAKRIMRGNENHE